MGHNPFEKADFMADPQKPTEEPGRLVRALLKVDAGMRAAANTVTFGYADKFAAWADSKTRGGTFEQNLEMQKTLTNYDAKNNAGAVFVGQAAGVVATTMIGENIAGAAKAFRAGYTGTTATAAVVTAAGGTSAVAPAAEAVTTAVNSAKPFLVRAKDMAGNAATKVKEAVLHPIETAKATFRVAKTAGKFVAAQGTALIGAAAVEKLAEGTVGNVVGEARAATGVDAVDVDSNKLASAGATGAAALGIAKIASILPETGRRGVAKKIFKNLAMMTGLSGGTAAAVELAASGQVIGEEGRSGNAPVTAGIVAATAATAAGVLNWKQMGVRQAWGVVTQNTGAIVSFAAVNSIDLITSIPQRVAEKYEDIAKGLPPQNMPTQTDEVLLAQAPAAASSLAQPLLKSAYKQEKPTQKHAKLAAVKAPVQPKAEGILLGISNEAQTGLRSPDFFMQATAETDTPTVKVAEVAPAQEKQPEKIDVSVLNQSLGAEKVPDVTTSALNSTVEAEKIIRPVLVTGTPKLDNLG